MLRAQTKTQVDRLGDRLKQENKSEEDLRALDRYRRSFGAAYESVITLVRDRLGLQPTGRAAKSTTAIVEKLQRESIRLSQVQDVAGCRLVVSDLNEQDRVVRQLCSLFVKPRVVDRRTKASHGYRAVHVVIDVEGKLVEIQVRTVLQHLWAELSEKLNDRVDPGIKYGGGSEPLQSSLDSLSKLIARTEKREAEADDSESARARARLHDDLAQIVEKISNIGGVSDVVSD
jgi:putative GTP pyrophosphokinase